MSSGVGGRRFDRLRRDGNDRKFVSVLIEPFGPDRCDALAVPASGVEDQKERLLSGDDRPHLPSLIDDIEDEFSREAGVELPSVRLGALVMERLKPIDRVAYVRFASVYRNFQDAGEFQEFVDEMAAAQDREEQRRNQVEMPI